MTSLSITLHSLPSLSCPFPFPSVPSLRAAPFGAGFVFFSYRAVPFGPGPLPRLFTEINLYFLLGVPFGPVPSGRSLQSLSFL